MKTDRILGWNICETCINSYGGCEWTACDPITERVRFEPVPGWTAQLTIRGKRDPATYIITDCPKYKRDPAFGRDKGNTNPPRPVVCIAQDGAETVYRSARAAATALGHLKGSSNISEACTRYQGKSDRAYGYRWRHLEAHQESPCARCHQMPSCRHLNGCNIFRDWVQTIRKED